MDADAARDFYVRTWAEPAIDVTFNDCTGPFAADSKGTPAAAAIA